LTKTGDPKAKAFEKSEDPVYVAENEIPVDYHYYFENKFLNPVCDLLDPLFENTKDEIFGEIINQHQPPKKKKEPTFSGMKKGELVEECKNRNLASDGTIVELKQRLKSNLEKANSIEDLFKKYEQDRSKQ
jgi:DNA polymerase delta subunit 1